MTAASVASVASSTDGFILLRKRPGETSFASLSRVKRRFGTKRVGHCGTLDKFAEGLLIVMIGRATRLVPWFTAASKEYLATIRFGFETDTLDPDGAVVAEAPPPAPEALSAVLADFRGDIAQRPPEYSAIHIAGQRAYRLALSGQAVDVPARLVTIHTLELLEYGNAAARLRIVCSKGTYIRSLARDIALACASRAHLSVLTRIASGGFRLEDAVDIPDDPTVPIDPASLRPFNQAACRSLGLTVLQATPVQAKRLVNGWPIAADWLVMPAGLETAAWFSDDFCLAIVERVGDHWRYAYVAVMETT